MAPADPGSREKQDGPGQADVRVLGQLLAAQNLLSVLPTEQHVADFYALALASVPGVSAADVCLPGGSSRTGARGAEPCAGCQVLRSAAEEGATLSREFTCKLGDLPDIHVVALETTGAHLGVLVLRVGRHELFELYRPFIGNLGNFLALSLENRMQRRGLQRGRDALELRVVERTEELRLAIRKLGEEVEERKRAEASVRTLNLELEQRVRDRTAQLEEANEELEAFAYSASHDLRAPLRHIIGFLELFRKTTATSLDEQSQHYIAAVSDAATRMGRLIDDLLSFSRMGRCDLSRSPVDLGALVREVVRELEPDTRDRAIRWSIADLPTVTGDRAMLHAALGNLLSNALKFTRPRPSAEIEVGLDPGPDPELVIFVRDNGVGFDMTYANKLFGVFERLHHATEFEGTGIGLANVRRIIHRHGGRTWAHGEVGRGATFYFSLPPDRGVKNDP
jgi:signal transduction histidine kinase